MIKRIIFIFFLTGFASCKKENNEKIQLNSTYDSQNSNLKLNQIQIIASHNSYRIRTTDTILRFIYGLQNNGFLPNEFNPDGLDYTHLNFNEQLNNFNIRGLEIDVYYDAQGNTYHKRKINTFAGLVDSVDIPELKQPGFKVLHIKDIDYNTYYYTFKQALQALKQWSNEHPRHLPIFVNIETKEESPADYSQLNGLGFTPAQHYNETACDELDNEIKTVFGNDLSKIMTPDNIRKSLPTLRSVITEGKMPTLGECRGKIFFILEGNALPYYTSGHPSLSGRVMFTYANYNTDEAFFLIHNNAESDKFTIQSRVNEGFIVRTRADADTEQARTGNYNTMNAALSSGAQIVSTDYYQADPRYINDPAHWTNYTVQLPDNALGRKNPINALQVNVPNDLVE